MDTKPIYRAVRASPSTPALQKIVTNNWNNESNSLACPGFTTLTLPSPDLWTAQASTVQHNHSISNTVFFLLFLHNRHGTKEIPDWGNLVRPDWVGNLRWDNTEPYEPFRLVNTEPSMQFRKANTDPSVQFRKANTDPSVQFRKANTDPSMQIRWEHTEFLSCKILGKNLH